MSQEFSVKTQCAPLQIRIGDYVRCSADIRYPMDARVELQWLASIDEPLALLKRELKPVVRQGAYQEQHYDYIVTAYMPGEQPLPTARLYVQAPEGALQQAEDRVWVLDVQSLLPSTPGSAGAATEQDIRSPKPLVELPRHQAWWFGLAALLLVVASLAVLWFRRRRLSEPVATPVMPPHERALEQLRALRLEQLPQQGAFEVFYTRLSAIVRVYIEERFGVRAPEMTTEEFLQAATQAAALTTQHRQYLQAFLRQSDLVKFARYHPSAHEAEQAFVAAEHFVLESRPLEIEPLVNAEAATREPRGSSHDVA